MRLSALQLGGIFAVVSIVPLALLTYFSVSLASDAVKRDAEERVSLTASLGADNVRREMQGLEGLVESYAGRHSLIAAVSKNKLTPQDRATLRDHLSALQSAQDGIYTAFIAKPDGTLIDVVPATPSIVGKNYSFRDWYTGLERTGHPYVSEAYRTQAAGKGLVVAVAAVRPRRPCRAGWDPGCGLQPRPSSGACAACRRTKYGVDAHRPARRDPRDDGLDADGACISARRCLASRPPLSALPEPPSSMRSKGAPCPPTPLSFPTLAGP